MMDPTGIRFYANQSNRGAWMSGWINREAGMNCFRGTNIKQFIDRWAVVGSSVGKVQRAPANRFAGVAQSGWMPPARSAQGDLDENPYSSLIIEHLY
jgi:hypothetical protein